MWCIPKVDHHFVARMEHVLEIYARAYDPHTEASLYLAFSPEEARRILQRLKFHFTPPHASWLNMVEIEIGVMNRQCLDRRIEGTAELVRELAAWEQERNDAQASVKWMFDIPTARKRLASSYPQPVRTSAS